ncbi:MAG: type II secretion system protein [Elusimicrobiota bacterium]
MRSASRTSDGFTLAEILVTMMVLGIVTYALGPLLLSSKLLLRKGYGRAEAIEIASMKMEENLAKSYSGLASSQGTECLAGNGWIDVEDNAECRVKAGDPFDWRVTVSDLAGTSAPPCRKIEVQVSYREDKELRQTVSLVNFVPYPHIHVVSEYVRGSRSLQATPTYTLLYSVPLSFATKKSIQLSYNFAIRVIDAKDIQPLDTIYTQARVVRNGVPIAVFYPETRTPILTQPLINNWAEVDNLSLRDCRFEILWRKQTAVSDAGAISLKMGNVILIAVEENAAS